MISYNIYGVERYGLLCNGNRDFRIDEEFGNFICKDNGFQKLDFISSNEKEYFDFITGMVIRFENWPLSKIKKIMFLVSFDPRIYGIMCILERLGPYAGTHFQNDLYGSSSYQCLPDFTVGGAKCPEGAQNMNDCDIDDYARHGNFDSFLLLSTGHF